MQFYGVVCALYVCLYVWCEFFFSARLCTKKCSVVSLAQNANVRRADGANTHTPRQSADSVPPKMVEYMMQSRITKPSGKIGDYASGSHILM